ncbi:MAG: response regulator [Elusimicrobia bacterium]|nr:response regulator [Elusimicrobiota bacterium]
MSSAAKGRTRVLVVEDEEDYGQLLVEALSEAGFAVRWEKSAASGLEAASAEPPDLVILDVQLPDGTGFDVCRKLRAGGPAMKTPVLFCTVRSAIAPVAEGTRAGGNGYLLKPFAIEDLLARVRAALGER